MESPVFLLTATLAVLTVRCPTMDSYYLDYKDSARDEVKRRYDQRFRGLLGDLQMLFDCRFLADLAPVARVDGCEAMAFEIRLGKPFALPTRWRGQFGFSTGSMGFDAQNGGE